jgi:hypothetical protein
MKFYFNIGRMISQLRFNDEAPSEEKGRDHRCLCGQLLARLTPAGVELKCKRCRRIHVVPWTAVKRD